MLMNLTMLQTFISLSLNKPDISADYSSPQNNNENRWVALKKRTVHDS